MKKKDVNYYMNLPYKIIIRKDPHGGFFAKVEELEGFMTNPFGTERVKSTLR